MTLTQITEKGIKDGEIVNADINASAAIARTKLANVDLVDDTSPQLGGDLDTNSHNISIDDDHKINFGDSSDLHLIHNGTDSFIQNTTGDLYINNTSGTSDDIIIKATSNIFLMPQNGEYGVSALSGGGVELYYDNARKFRTVSDGCEITSSEAGDACLSLIADEGDDNADYFRLKTANTGGFYLQNYAAGSWENNIKAIGNGAVELYHNNGKKFETNSSGAFVTGELGCDTLYMGDSEKAKFGNNDDLQIFHDGTDSYLINYGGYLYVDSGTSDIRFISDGSWANGKMATFYRNAQVELFYDNVKKFETQAQGTKFYGTRAQFDDSVKIAMGTNADLQIYHDGTDSHIQNTNNSGELKIRAHQTDIKNADNNETQAVFHENGAVELYYDNGKCLETANDGGVKGQGNFIVATAGRGLQFNASDSGSNEILDDYEEGTWVPAHSSNGGSIASGGSYSQQNGTYTKIGDRVHISGYLNWGNGWSGGGGSYAIELPFTQNNSPSTYAAVNIGFLHHSGGALTIANERIGGYVSGNKILFYRIPTGQSTGNVAGGTITNSTWAHSAGYVQFNLTMRV